MIQKKRKMDNRITVTVPPEVKKIYEEYAKIKSWPLAKTAARILVAQVGEVKQRIVELKGE